MKHWTRNTGVFLGAVSMALSGSSHAAPNARSTSLSVMTYNVHGLPWPLVRGRSAAFDSMVARLRAMRHDGTQPHIIVLQEAFTPEAKAIGRRSGYRYVAFGPATTDHSSEIATPRDHEFANRASWLKGERSGKILDSGLQILSDYPILSVRTQPFPDFACAGFDCLANKGILMALVEVPGSATPVVVSTAHFNSRKASGVSFERSNYAYNRQWSSAEQFLAKSEWHQFPMIFAGDFNVGKSAQRQATFSARAATIWKTDRKGRINDALRACHTAFCTLPVAAREALSRAKDWQLFASTKLASLAVEGVRVPFGRAFDGTMLSDHIGYSARYRISGPSATQIAYTGEIAEAHVFSK